MTVGQHVLEDLGENRPPYLSELLEVSEAGEKGLGVAALRVVSTLYVLSKKTQLNGDAVPLTRSWICHWWYWRWHHCRGSIQRSLHSSRTSCAASLVTVQLLYAL